MRIVPLCLFFLIFGSFLILHETQIEPRFRHGDLVYKFKRIVGKPNFSDQFKTIIKGWFKYILFDQSLLHRYNIKEVGSDSKP